jgi:hypothetical protein
VDLPVREAGRGFQNVPEYRLNGSANWKF